ncbi:hypothetical protein OG21DRAFT_1485363 [Imleria badia]|nr:hypothetical protein OG21DRAFT_1485363 [Imleria badia]
MSGLMRFLASSITFMQHLTNVRVFFDNHCIGNIEKSLVASRSIDLPREPKKSSAKEIIMDTTEIQHHNIIIKATIMRAEYEDATTEKVDLSMFTAKADVTMNEESSDELVRCMKKAPPAELEYSLIYTGKDEEKCDGGSESHSQGNRSHDGTSIFQGLRADLNEARHTRIFIGHATTQTTGIGGHMASRFIPTIERELIDLSATNAAIHHWNSELLHVGGLLSRAVYEWELSNIQQSWEQGATGNLSSRPSLELQDQLNQRFLHVLRFFTFHPSTPAPEVSRWLKDAFYGCSQLPLMLLSSVGVCGAADLRIFDPAFAFLKPLPMLSEYVTRNGVTAITSLPDSHKIRSIEPSDVQRSLDAHTLNEEDLVSFLRWWITLQRKNPTWSTENLLHSAILSGTDGRRLPLSSVEHFVDPKGLGAYIPADGPLPSYLLPLTVYKHFSRADLASIRWREFTVNNWLEHLSDPRLMSAYPRYDFTKSIDWAARVLGTLSRLWPSLSDEMRHKAKEILENRPCIPTTHGLLPPDSSYLLVANDNPFHNLELAIVQFSPGLQTNRELEMVLTFIGVRMHVPPEVFLDRMDIWDGSVSVLIRYLVKVQIPSNEVDKLKSLGAFTEEAPTGNASDRSERLRYRVDELYPPESIFHGLQLPIISWDEEWSNDSPEAQLMYRLGLRRFPPLGKIVELCASSDASVRIAAFLYLCNNIGSCYPDYKPEDFRDVAFIPAENCLERGIHLKTLDNVCWGTQWRVLGFSVAAEPTTEPVEISFSRLGIQQHPSSSTLLARLQTTSRDEGMASQWFECLADCISSLRDDHRSTLSGMQIVPTRSSGVLQWVTPVQCYLGHPKDEFTRDLCIFVGFGMKANQFLSACGSKDEPSVKDIAECLIDDPERFYKLAGGPQGFLAKLRDLAIQVRRTPNLNDTLEKMVSKRTLLGVRRIYDDDGQRTDVYELRKPEEIVIIDDTKDGELFNESIWASPEEDLESFYASIGCRKLSRVVKEQYEYSHEIEDHETACVVKDLVLERLPIFLERCTNTRPKIHFNSFRDKFRVRVCDTLRVSKTFTIGKNTTKTQEVWAAAKHDAQAGIELWISRHARRDIYDLAVSLCRLVFGTAKGHDTLVLAAMLSDRELLKRAGFHVEQDPKQRLPKVFSDEPISSSSMEPSSSASQRGTSLLFSRRHGSSAFHNAGHSVKGGPVSNRETLGMTKTKIWPPSQVIPQSLIRAQVKSAIDDCTSGPGDFHRRTDAIQSLNAGYCNDDGPVGNLQLRGKIGDIEVHVAEGVPEFDMLMKDKHEPLGRFVGTITPIATAFNLPITSLHIFYDVPGGPIAFNRGGNIYLNLRFFEEWHDADVKIGDRERALSSWSAPFPPSGAVSLLTGYALRFFALAHELAHNLVMEHNSDHEFWFSAICEEHFAALSQLLRFGNPQVESNQGGFSRIGLSSFLCGYR